VWPEYEEVKKQLLIYIPNIKTMGLRYDFYENPLPKGSNRKPRLHTRVVTGSTTTTDEIATRIHDASSLTVGDVKASLLSLIEVMANELASGRRVHLEGLGYFQLTLSSPSVKSPKEIRAESIRVKSVAFRAETSFKKRFLNIPLERVREKRHSNRYSEIEIDGLLTSHFLDNTYITSRKFQTLCGFTESTAKRRLRQLIANGKLRKTGHRQFPLYEPVKGNFRR